MRETIEIINQIENFELVCYVPIRNTSHKARILRKDFEELWAIGARLPWNIHHGRVKVRASGSNNLDIARLIMDAREREHIRFLDGNELNLVRDNLIRKLGGSAADRSRDYIIPRFNSKEPIIKHIELHAREGLNYN